MSVMTLKPENLVSLMYFLRGERMLLSEQLATLYGVSVGALKQAVKRNFDRFLRSRSLCSAVSGASPTSVNPTTHV